MAFHSQDHRVSPFFNVRRTMVSKGINLPKAKFSFITKKGMKLLLFMLSKEKIHLLCKYLLGGQVTVGKRTLWLNMTLSDRRPIIIVSHKTGIL